MHEKDKELLYRLVYADNLWECRISIIATFYFIRQNEFDDTLKIAEILLNDKEDLIHKAVGWMLREVGKREIEIEEEFLQEYYKKMPRTMLRYAIEKFPETSRKMYLSGEVLLLIPRSTDDHWKRKLQDVKRSMTDIRNGRTSGSNT